MGLTAFHSLLWLLSALTLTTQELVKLSVNPKITAECGKKVTLNCNVSSLSQLSIKHMTWSRETTSPICAVDSEGNVERHQEQSISDFNCEYKHGQLSLIFKQVQPWEIGKYRCELRSNRGAPCNYTTVELEECSGTVKGVSTEDGLVHSCTFNRVYPDGDVDWFYGSHSLSDVSPFNTSKQVDKEGWLTIRSDLRREKSNVAYNCSLKGTKSGRYIASTLFLAPAMWTKDRYRNGVGSHRPARTFLCISILLAVTLK